jgi:hypothetical protein
MKPTSAAEPPIAEAEATDLPWFHSWRGVYIFVFGSFILWVALLFALTLSFS